MDTLTKFWTGQAHSWGEKCPSLRVEIGRSGLSLWASVGVSAPCYRLLASIDVLILCDEDQ